MKVSGLILFLIHCFLLVVQAPGFLFQPLLPLLCRHGFSLFGTIRPNQLFSKLHWSRRFIPAVEKLRIQLVPPICSLMSLSFSILVITANFLPDVSLIIVLW